MQITVSKEYEDLVPPLTTEEYSALKQSIQENGLWVPIIVNDKGIVLDGHHRFRVCRELGIDFKVAEKVFDDTLDEQEFVIECNLKRRQLNDFQKAELGYRLEDIEKRKAEQRQKSGTLLPNGSKGEAAEFIADRVGLSPRTYYRAKRIIEEAPEELKEKVRSGETSISYAAKTVTRAEDHRAIPELPEGQYDIILADPPWNYDINTRGSPDDHYAVMTNEQIEGLQVPSADNAILFLWATAPKIREALDVMRSWGFKYKTNAVWVKQHFGTGYYFRGQHELLLVGERGEMPVPEEHNRVSSVINADKTKHSVKPTIIYDIVERMYPNRKYLELFARSKYSDKWTVWGNEIQVTQ